MKSNLTKYLASSLFLILCLAGPTSLGQKNNKTQSFEDFVKIYDSLVYSNELDLAYNLLTEEKYHLDRNGDYNDLYYSILYKRIKDQYKKGNYIESITLSRSLISSYPKTDSLLADTYAYLANSYYTFKDYEIALDFYFKAKNIYGKIGDYKNVAHIIGNIGLIYNNLKEYERAISYYEQQKAFLAKHGLEVGAYVYIQMARLHTRNKNFELSEIYLDSAVSAAHHQSDIIGELYAIRSKGYNYYSQDRFSEAKPFYEEAYEKYLSLGNTNLALDCSRKLAYIHYYSKEFDEAISLSETMLSIAYSTNNLSDVVLFSKIIYKALIAQERYKEAVFIQQSFKQAEDSIKSIQLESHKYKIQMQFDAEKRSAENELLKQQKIADQETIRAQNILLISVCIGLILVVLIALIIYRTYITNKKLTGTIQKQSDRLKQLDEAKSRFFANISHDLRTPLTLIMGGIEQVLKSEDLLLTEKAERQLKTGLLNGERIVHLTNEINELIKLEDGKLIVHKQFVDVDKMLKVFVRLFDSIAEMKGIHLSYSKSIFDGSAILHIDPSQFEKVIFNLITNAFKHTKKDDFITLSLNKGDNCLIISVIDSGEGIPEQNIPYIFERYYQAPETTFSTQEGFGIGLALVKEIIHKHGAKIDVKSKLGEGSEFIISIPQENISSEQSIHLPDLAFTSKTRELFKEMDEPELSETPVVNISGSESKEDKKTILLVEDHPEIRDFIQSLIESKYHVLTAQNGKRALKVLDKEKVDLIITDLMMPWFDGFELLEKLKGDENLRKIPALVLSARTSEEDKSRVLSQGVNDFLCKPFKPEELLQRIENLLDQKELWNNNKEAALFINNPETLADIEKSLIKKVESLIFDRIDDPNLSVNHLADQIAVSERKFYRMIKKMTDSTPFEFIKEIRLQYANRILKEKKVSSASEVAKSIGMNNVSHFNTQFKKRFGKTPAEFI
ncbi:response regulator [Reichenbachiella sp.]|uniref:response regulator n=1 Tax=Reichenbachiella sp. TaxID=2184521 RepID=UPI003B5BADB7